MWIKGKRLGPTLATISGGKRNWFKLGLFPENGIIYKVHPRIVFTARARFDVTATVSETGNICFSPLEQLPPACRERWDVAKRSRQKRNLRRPPHKHMHVLRRWTGRKWPKRSWQFCLGGRA